MEYLSFSSNQLSGSLPDEFSAATDMISVRLDNNQLSGSLPSLFGNLSKISRLNVNSNSFSGPIPSEFGLLTNCNEFYADANALTGTIPEELEFLITNGTLTRLNLTLNSLNGKVPEGLCVLDNETASLFTKIDFDCDALLCGCGCLCSNQF